MKRKICIALSVIMVMMTLLMPMGSWADNENDSSQSTDTQTEQSSDNSKDSGTSTEKSEKNTEDSSSKTSDSKSETKSDTDSESTTEKDTEEKSTDTQTDTNTYTYNYQTETEETESNIDKGTISIIFTSDMHSHFDSESKTVDGKTKECGGLARAVSIFQKISPAYKEDSFLLDGGDFSMGTCYQTIFKSEAAELRMLGYAGYDAVTLGNHEFDYGDGGLAEMLNAAVKKTKLENKEAATDEDKVTLPELCISNIDWDSSEGEDVSKLQKAFEKYDAEEEYTVIKKNGIKIAVFGINGEDSAMCATESGLAYSDRTETAKKIVEDIKANEKDVKLIVCLSHSGTSTEADESEDEILAEAVPDIDLIISGHTHTVLEEPITVGDTVIASCGAYNQNVGYVTFTKDKESGEYTLDKYKLYELTSKVDEDEDTLAKLAEFKTKVNSEYFKTYGYTADQVIATNSISFTSVEDFAEEQGEDTLGNLLSDSYIYAVKEVEGSKYEDVAVSVVPQGVVRASLPKGKVRASDAFNIFSSSSGADGTGATPLISVYITGKDLKCAAEVDATVSDSMIYARLYCSGMSYKINKHRLILNRAFDIQLTNGDETTEIDNDKLYRVVTDLNTAQMLANVNEESKGLLTITPRDENGNEITDFDECVIQDGNHELKAWQATAMYLEKMGKVDSKYAETEGRKIVSDSRSLRELLCQPNKVGWMLRGAIILVIVIILLIILFINRKKFTGRTKRSKGSMTYTVSERQKKAIFAPPKKQKNLFADNGRKSRRNRRNGRY